MRRPTTIGVSARCELVSGDFNAAFMYAPMHDELGQFAEPPPELKLGPDIVWRLPVSFAWPPPSSASIPRIACVDLGEVEFRT